MRKRKEDTVRRDRLFSNWLRDTFRHRGRKGFCERKRQDTYGNRRTEALIPSSLKRRLEKYAKAHCASQGKVVEFALREYLGYARGRMEKV